MIFAYKKSDQSRQQINQNSAFVGNVSGFISAFMNHHEGVQSDYSFWETTDADNIAKVNDGWAFDLVWDDDPPNGVITGIDFTPETDKKYLKILLCDPTEPGLGNQQAIDDQDYLHKDTIIANGTDSLVVRVEIWATDLSAKLLTNFSGRLPILRNDIVQWIDVAFSQGYVEKTLKSTRVDDHTIRVPAERKRFDAKAALVRLHPTFGSQVITILANSTDFWG